MGLVGIVREVLAAEHGHHLPGPSLGTVHRQGAIRTEQGVPAAMHPLVVVARLSGVQSIHERLTFRPDGHPMVLHLLAVQVLGPVYLPVGAVGAVQSVHPDRFLPGLFEEVGPPLVIHDKVVARSLLRPPIQLLLLVPKAFARCRVEAGEAHPALHVLLVGQVGEHRQLGAIGAEGRGEETAVAHLLRRDHVQLPTLAQRAVQGEVMHQQGVFAAVLVPVRHEGDQPPVHHLDGVQEAAVAHDTAMELHLLRGHMRQVLGVAFQPVVLHRGGVGERAQEHEPVITQRQQPLDAPLGMVVGDRRPPPVDRLLGLCDTQGQKARETEDPHCPGVQEALYSCTISRMRSMP